MGIIGGGWHGDGGWGGHGAGVVGAPLAGDGVGVGGVVDHGPVVDHGVAPFGNGVGAGNFGGEHECGPQDTGCHSTAHVQYDQHHHTTVYHRPDIVVPQAPDVIHRPDIVIHRAPIVVHRRPLIYHQSPVVVHKPPVVVHQSPIIVHPVVHHHKIVTHHVHDYHVVPHVHHENHDCGCAGKKDCICDQNSSGKKRTLSTSSPKVTLRSLMEKRSKIHSSRKDKINKATDTKDKKST